MNCWQSKICLFVYFNTCMLHIQVMDKVRLQFLRYLLIHQSLLLNQDLQALLGLLDLQDLQCLFEFLGHFLKCLRCLPILLTLLPPDLHNQHLRSLPDHNLRYHRDHLLYLQDHLLYLQDHLLYLQYQLQFPQFLLRFPQVHLQFLQYHLLDHHILLE